MNFDGPTIAVIVGAVFTGAATTAGAIYRLGRKSGGDDANLKQASAKILELRGNEQRLHALVAKLYGKVPKSELSGEFQVIKHIVDQQEDSGLMQLAGMVDPRAKK